MNSPFQGAIPIVMFSTPMSILMFPRLTADQVDQVGADLRKFAPA